MSRHEAATPLLTSLPPANITAVIEALEKSCEEAGIDTHTITLMASLIRERTDSYSDILKIEPERVLQQLELQRDRESPWLFYNANRLPELVDVHCWDTQHDLDLDLGEVEHRRYICPKCKKESRSATHCTVVDNHNPQDESCDATIWNYVDSSDNINPIIKLIIKSRFLVDLTVHSMFYPIGLQLS